MQIPGHPVYGQRRAQAVEKEQLRILDERPQQRAAHGKIISVRSLHMDAHVFLSGRIREDAQQHGVIENGDQKHPQRLVKPVRKQRNGDVQGRRRLQDQGDDVADRQIHGFRQNPSHQQIHRLLPQAEAAQHLIQQILAG